MNILKTFQTCLIDEEQTPQQLIIQLTECKGIYGLLCTLTPAGDHAEDPNITDCRKTAIEIYDILCREQVLPLNLYGVLDDILP